MRPQGAPQQRRGPSESHSRPLISAETGTQRPYSWPQAAWAFTAARTPHHSAGKGRGRGREGEGRGPTPEANSPAPRRERERPPLPRGIYRAGGGGARRRMRTAREGWDTGRVWAGKWAMRGGGEVAVGACAVGRRERRPPAVRGGHGGPAPGTGPAVRYRVAGATHRHPPLARGRV